MIISVYSWVLPFSSTYVTLATPLPQLVIVKADTKARLDNKIVDTIEETEGEVISNLIYDYNDYDYLVFNYENYQFNKIFDNKWKESININNKVVEKNNLLINLVNLDDDEYYVVLEIRDLNNKVHYTKLEKIK